MLSGSAPEGIRTPNLLIRIPFLRWCRLVRVSALTSVFVSKAGAGWSVWFGLLRAVPLRFLAPC